MAQLIGEKKGRQYNDQNRTMTFIVRAEQRSEDAEDILAAVPVVPGMWHPKSFGYYADTPDVTQDSVAWWKWIVVWNFKRVVGNEDPETNPDSNPLLFEPEISIDFQTIEVDAKGELLDDGTYRPIANSAGEPYDPHPREELEIMMISIARNEAPAFSLKKLRQFQNGVNATDWDFGDETIESGKAKIRIRVSPKRSKVLELDQQVIQYRRYEYMIAVNPLGWDIELLDWGPSYISGIDEGGNPVSKLFSKTDDKEMGLLDGSGGKLPSDGVAQFLTWQNKERVAFGDLNLPQGP